MRGRIGKASIGASLVLHAVVALLLVWRHAPVPAPSRRAAPIEVTTYVAPPPAVAPAVVAPAIVRERRSRTPSSEPRAASPPSPAAPPSPTAPPPTAPPPTAPPPTAPPGTIDLFSHDALAHAAGAKPAPVDPGGHLRRAGDPTPPGEDERETLSARTREWLDDAAARDRASSGKLAPRWRDIERTLAQGFHPPLDSVKQESVGKALAHQILRSWLDGPPQTGTVARGVDASNEIMLGTPPGLNIRDTPAQQAAAVQARWGAAATSLTVEVEVTLDAGGNIVAARVIHPSGRRAFDRVALAAVRDAIRAGGAPDEGCTVVTRWRVDAAVAVAPPTSIGFRFDETGHLDPNARGWRRYLAPVTPMQQEVQTHVALVAIAPRR